MIWAALAIGAAILLWWELRSRKTREPIEADARGASVPSSPRRRAGRSYRCFVAGTSHSGPTGNRSAYIWEQVKAGDRLIMRPEPDNAHDPNAVAFWHRDFHIGYVPARYPWVLESIREGDRHEVIVEGVEPSDEHPRTPFVTLTIRVEDSP